MGAMNDPLLKPTWSHCKHTKSEKPHIQGIGLFWSVCNSFLISLCHIISFLCAFDLLGISGI